MSARKKTFVKSAFSQMSGILEKNNNNNEVDTEPEGTPKTRRSKRNVKQDSVDTTTVRKSARGNKTTTPLKASITIVLDDDNDEEETTADAQLKENWIDIFAPNSIEELAVHPKKIEEIQKWFHHCEFMSKQKKHPAQLCVITGPSGSGKTAALKVVAKQMKYSIQEWINPVDQEIVVNLGDQVYSEPNFVSSQVDAFKGFLFKASRYRSLFELSADKRLLMVEDFPNFLLRDPSVFEEILDNYISFGKCPLVFIVTDAKRRGLNISYNLFTDPIKQKFLINHINFNPVASTLMRKAMQRFCSLMILPPHNKLYRPPTTNLLESIIVSAQGDVRNALINLHFSSMKGAPTLLKRQLENSIQEPGSSSRKRKVQSSLKSVGRDDSLTIMHALGQVFNPKFTDSKRFLHSPEEISEAYSSEPKNFLDLIHANYIGRFRDIESLLIAANGISFCDLILKEYRNDSLPLIALNVGVRHVMVANEKPVTGWMPIRGPKRINTDIAKIPSNALKVLPTHHSITKTLYALDYKTYVDRINPVK